MSYNADKFLTAYVEAVDRYTNAVDAMCRLANGMNHAAFVISRQRVKEAMAEVAHARAAMRGNREGPKQGD